MVLKHSTRATDKHINLRYKKLADMSRELNQLKKTLGKRLKSEDEIFNNGFVLSLILLCRSYPPLHEHAFNILQEAGYELNDFNHTKLDPSDRETLHQIFSV